MGGYQECDSSWDRKSCLQDCWLYDVEIIISPQVCPDKVILLAGSAKLSESSVQQILAPPATPTGVQGEKAAESAQPEALANVQIMAAAAADPYVLLHLSNGSAALLSSTIESGVLSTADSCFCGNCPSPASYHVHAKASASSLWTS